MLSARGCVSHGRQFPGAGAVGPDLRTIRHGDLERYEADVATWTLQNVEADIEAQEAIAAANQALREMGRPDLCGDPADLDCLTRSDAEALRRGLAAGDDKDVLTRRGEIP
jgi:hypothetical protein